MPINPDFDLKKVPLQAAVAYLISLHDNEVDWNLLGIRVIGAIDALPIPAGNYEYGDAYMVGTETPYDMYIYTRPDGKVHTEGYWFPIGKFPMPGPQGPKGDGLEQINKWTNGTANNVTYDIINGAKVTQLSTVDYKDSTNGSTKQQQFETTTTLPIIPGKYISMNTTPDHKKMEVRVNGTALSQDYIKLDKTKSGVIPQNNDGVVNWVPTSVNPTAKSIVQRDADGDCGFHFIKIDGITNINSREIISYWQLWRNIYSEALSITKTATDTGTLTAGDLTQLQSPGYHMVKYKDQLYYRYDPRNAPDGTLNYIHLDSIQDGNGGYKATGKCFSVTVSTRAWKVFDLDFGGSTRTTHNLCITDNVFKISTYFQLINNHPESYTTADAAILLQAIEGKSIPCTVKKKEEDTSSTFHAGIIQVDGGHFKLSYGETTPQGLPIPADSQIVIEDKLN